MPNISHRSDVLSCSIHIIHIHKLHNVVFSPHLDYNYERVVIIDITKRFITTHTGSCFTKMIHSPILHTSSGSILHLKTLNRNRPLPLAPSEAGSPVREVCECRFRRPYSPWRLASFGGSLPRGTGGPGGGHHQGLSGVLDGVFPGGGASHGPGWGRGVQLLQSPRDLQHLSLPPLHIRHGIPDRVRVIRLHDLSQQRTGLQNARLFGVSVGVHETRLQRAQRLLHGEVGVEARLSVNARGRQMRVLVRVQKIEFFTCREFWFPTGSAASSLRAFSGIWIRSTGLRPIFQRSGSRSV